MKCDKVHKYIYLEGSIEISKNEDFIIKSEPDEETGSIRIKSVISISLSFGIIFFCLVSKDIIQEIVEVEEVIFLISSLIIGFFKVIEIVLLVDHLSLARFKIKLYISKSFWESK